MLLPSYSGHHRSLTQLIHHSQCNSWLRPLLTLKMPPKNILHKFTHYPPLKLAISQVDLDVPTSVTAGELQGFRKSWFEAIEPLLKHIEQPAQARKLLSTFDGTPTAPPTAYAQIAQLPALQLATSWDLWGLVEDIAALFPGIIFAQLHQTTADTLGRSPGGQRRNRWIRKRLLKDLRTCETLLTAMRESVVFTIVECEENERDQRLLVLDHILQNVLQDSYQSVKTLIKRLTG